MAADNTFQTSVPLYPAQGIPGSYAAVNPIVSPPLGYIVKTAVSEGIKETGVNFGTFVSGTVKAVVPDICEAEFVQYFGTEVPFTKTEYKVGPGGWISQWGKSFTDSLVKVKTIPAYLEQYLNPKRTQVTNSEYIKDLVDNYGFQFGKEQNVEAIRKSVPAEYLPHFEAGFAA